jgi:hypothetical protein
MAYTERSDVNYLGKLFLIGATQTPFLNMIGGLTGGGKTYPSFNFPISQPWTLRAADQSTAVKSEDTSISDVTPLTRTRTQVYNTCQIMKYPYAVSFAKQSTFGEISGVAIAGQTQPVTDELGFQRMAALRQLAVDLEYSFLRGAYVAQSAGETVAKTQGIIAACAAGSNTTSASSGALSAALIRTTLLEAFTNGAPFVNMVMFLNGFQKQALSQLYGYAPEDRLVGGVNINQIYTDFGVLGVVVDPYMPTDTILFADMSVISPVFCPSEGQVIRDTPVAMTTAQTGGFLYTQVGLDFGPETYHATLTNLATS